MPNVAVLQHSENYTNPDLYMGLYALQLGGLLGASMTDDCLHVEALQGSFTAEQLQFLSDLKQTDIGPGNGGEGGGPLVPAAEGAGADDAGAPLGGDGYQVRKTGTSVRK